MFFAFSYRGQIYSGVASEPYNDDEDPEWKCLEEDWVLGEHLLSIPFKDAVVDAILSKLKRGPTYPKTLQQQPRGCRIKTSTS